VSYVVQREQFSGTWIGYITSLNSYDSEGNENVLSTTGTFTLTVYNSIWTANIRLGTNLSTQYEIRPIADRLDAFKLSLVNVFLRYEDGDEANDAASMDFSPIPKTNLLHRRSLFSSDNDDILDVGVLWTPQARVSAGSYDAMISLVNLAIDESNTIMYNSHVPLRLRLTVAKEILNASYVEPPGGIIDILVSLMDQADGIFDVDTATRYSDGSDVIVMLAATIGACGVAPVIVDDGNDGTSSYALVHKDCATGTFSFLHEIGHLLGACHDDYCDGK
jgi:hypothetical protein